MLEVFSNSFSPSLLCNEWVIKASVLQLCILLSARRNTGAEVIPSIYAHLPVMIFSQSLAIIICRRKKMHVCNLEKWLSN